MTSVYFFTYEKKSGEMHSSAAYNALTAMGAEGIKYLENGKPVADNCYVSVSHSGTLGAVCMSDRPVGIDVEKIDADRNFVKLSNRLFGIKEQQYFCKNPTPQTFYEMWTRKEAYSKISGEGIRKIQRGFDTFLLSDVSFQTEIINGYAITLCEGSV